MPNPSHRAPETGARRLSRAGAALLAVVLVVPVVAGVVIARRFDGDAGAATAAAQSLPRVQELVDARQLVPVRRVVAATEVEKIDLEALRAEREAAKAEKAEKAATSNEPFEVRVGSFNVLGSQHTAPGGDRQRYPPASTRNVGAVNLIGKHGVDILGTQELQADQLAALTSRTGMAAYPGNAWGSTETDNSILWDPGVFEMVSGSQFTITFMGHPHPQPILRLRHLATGREFYVVNTHPSAGGGRYAAERSAGQNALVSVVNNLKAEGVPVLVTGDMNDREAFYCSVPPRTGLVASNGGSYSGGCRPPASPLPVDWVLGYDVGWSGYWRDTTPVTQRTSDHYFISALASFGG
ncbi:hypothetical protein GCM10009623_30590 [Nocardioides aestuarii]|uniref:Endonuclease/exonuclease/phosphatase family protein n=1 Tax=Nocardioides aestuarii TaxID=252231 RepID=A0ABW4TQK1_9ACTN